MRPTTSVRYVRLLLGAAAKVAFLALSPIFMIPLQWKLRRQIRPKAHLLALHGLIVLVMQAVFVGVLGDMGTLEVVLITVFGIQALGIVAFLLAPSVEAETRHKDGIIVTEWYKDALWQGGMEAEIGLLKDRLDRIEKNSH